jgi:hypothetical protein
MCVHIDGLDAPPAHLDLPAPPTGVRLVLRGIHCAAARKYDTDVCAGCIIDRFSANVHLLFLWLDVVKDITTACDIFI